MPDREELLRRVMRRQLRLSLAVATVFVVVLAGLPLLNYFRPFEMAQRIGGFPLGWLILALLFYPLTWLLSAYFVRASDRLETELVQETRDREDAD
jgi:uncharacterized membrane protein (DUF485 family)